MTKNSSKIQGATGHRDRVQDKFLSLTDTASMADYELLELILMKAIPRIDVKPLAKELLNHFGTLQAVLTASADELCRFRHIKKSALVMFRLITETNKRIVQEKLAGRPVLSQWENMVDYCFLQLQHETIEQFLILYLDIHARLIRSEIQQKGTVDRVSIYPREVLKQALLLGADAVVIAHNHPSGNVQPSQADIQMTIELCKVMSAANIKFIDHLIVGSGRQLYSFSAHGHLSRRPPA